MKNESKTLFIPLYGKAMMSREGIFPDPWAEKLLEGQDFSGVDKSRKLAILMAMRAALLDDHARRYLREHPDCVVLQLGAGLDSRVKRVDCDAPWFDLDLPDVAAIRKEWYPENERCHIIGAPAVPADYLARLPDAPCALVMAEGLSMYLSESDMLELIRAFQRKWPETYFLFDAYTTLGVRMSALKNPVNAVDARISYGLDDPRALTDQLPGTYCSLNVGLISDAGLARLTGLDRVRFRFMRRPAERLYRLYGLNVNKM